MAGHWPPTPVSSAAISPAIPANPAPTFMRPLLAALAIALTTTLAHAANPMVELKTSAGTIVLELNAEKAPKTVENFTEYVRSGFYDGTVFHRVIDGFMIQGGGMTADLKEKPTRAPITNEAKNGLKNAVGTIAMARTQEPHSATAQLFINLVNNAPLDYPSGDGWGYAVFGRVTQGMEVVNKIAQTPTTMVAPYRDVPVTPIVIQSARLLPEAPAVKAK